MKTWVLYSALFGLPLSSSPVFNTESACYLYLNNTMGLAVAKAFGVHCVQQTVPMCQGEPCK